MPRPGRTTTSPAIPSAPTRTRTRRNRVNRWHQHAANLRCDLDDIERLPVNEAAELVSQRRAEAQARREAAERAARGGHLSDQDPHATASEGNDAALRASHVGKFHKEGLQDNDLEFIASLVASLAWPAALVVVALLLWMYLPELFRAFKRVKRLGAGT